MFSPSRSFFASYNVFWCVKMMWRELSRDAQEEYFQKAEKVRPKGCMYLYGNEI